MLARRRALPGIAAGRGQAALEAASHSAILWPWREEVTGVPEDVPRRRRPRRRSCELAGAAERAAAEPPRVVVPRWVQLVLLPLALLALWALAKAAGKVLLMFIVAGLIALILNPAVAFVQRARLPRGLAVLAVYLAFFLSLAGIGLLLANPISDQVRSFSHNVPHIVEEANKTIAERANGRSTATGLHVKLHQAGQNSAADASATRSPRASSSIVSFGGGAAHRSRQRELRPRAGVRAVGLHAALRPADRATGAPADARRRRHAARTTTRTLVQRAVSRYVGGQLLFSTIMGVTAGIALYIFGVIGIFPDGRKYAVVFGVFYGLMELVPYVGPILGAIPAVIVALFTKPISALWVAILFVGPAAVRGPRGGPAGVRAHAADQPAARDLRPAPGSAGQRR